MFLDIQMPGLTGLEVARQAEGRCHVVFVTAYDAYAVAAFEQGAVDYVLKPYDRGPARHRGAARQAAPATQRRRRSTACCANSRPRSRRANTCAGSTPRRARRCG